ncbi:hypothetical protein [Thermoactinomyces vulgaris]|jgi:hypothetical protein|uniref:hypothetical protein n=1 Tax=Thermoactinomyces vulgaris TaxID=2026 RepID=UPI00363E0B4A
MEAVRKVQPVKRLKESRLNRVIACENAPINWVWDEKDELEFIHMWDAGLSLQDIARAWPDRNPDDIIPLWLGLMYHEDPKKRLKDRPGGIWGRRRRG